MLKDKAPSQTLMEFVSVNDLVPADHLLRKIDKVVDFDFIHDLVKDRYCANNGRPALDPTLLFKLLFIGYLFGIRSERQLIRDVQVNVAYRWFLGLSLTDKIPDASTLSQTRRRRFADGAVYQQIFDEIVFQAMRRQLVSGKVLYTDSTHLKANANKGKWTKAVAESSSRDYIKALEAAIEEDRAVHGKKPLAKRSVQPSVRQIKQSTTDPDSGYMVRDGKPKGFFYLDHRSVDGRCNIITDVHVTAGNVHDSMPYLSRLDRQRQRFGFEVEAVGLDAGYFTAGVCKGLEDREIYGVISYRRPTHKQGYFHKREYRYDASNDTYTCPGKQTLAYATTDRRGYRQYRSDPSQCINCELRVRCSKNAQAIKTITRHVWEDSKERINQHRLTPSGRAIYERRKQTVERSFADAKQLHGYRHARFVGVDKVKAQCLMTAAAQNMKKMALVAA